ncbi:phage tail tube protein [Caulobacter sp. DWR3-1-2]|uniref:phage tail tube protein n=1 Tax=Caulobacter sp. DWR3-1-2 TaxID=2804647 RepID=UPI003CF72A9C
MAATAAMIGYNTTFAIDDIPTSGGYVEVAEVTNLSPPSDSIAIVDATHNKSPNATKEYIIGLNDPGDCKFNINFVPGGVGDAKIQAVRTARKKVSCRITWPNGVSWTFEGILTGYAPTAPTEDKMTAEVTFKATGAYLTVPAAVVANSVLPAVSGAAQVGQTLRALVGVWSGPAVFTFQWKKAGANIAGATNETYIPVGGDVGAAITVAVTATNAAGAASATSAATANVIA